MPTDCRFWRRRVPQPPNDAILEVVRGAGRPLTANEIALELRYRGWRPRRSLFYSRLAYLEFIDSLSTTWGEGADHDRLVYEIGQSE